MIEGFFGCQILDKRLRGGVKLGPKTKRKDFMKEVKEKINKPIYKRVWVWAVAVLVFFWIIGTIEKIINPDVVIPDVKGLTKIEACKKAEEAGFICKAGRNYDSSEKSQKVQEFSVYDKNGSRDTNAEDSMRAPKSSTINLIFEETLKQKTERESEEAKQKAEDAKKEAEEKAKKEQEDKNRAESSANSSVQAPTQPNSANSEYEKITKGMSESEIDQILVGYKKNLTSESEILGSKYKYVSYSKGDIFRGEKLKTISVTFENGVVESKSSSEF